MNCPTSCMAGSILRPLLWDQYNCIWLVGARNRILGISSIEFCSKSLSASLWPVVVAMFCLFELSQVSHVLLSSFDINSEPKCLLFSYLVFFPLLDNWGFILHCPLWHFSWNSRFDLHHSEFYWKLNAILKVFILKASYSCMFL